MRFFVATICFLTAAHAEDQARVQLMRYLDSIGQARLAERSHEIERIRSRADAERRKTAVRAKILRLMGGLPERHGAVPVKAFGNVAADGFRIEKSAYQSLPEFWVTANVYVPSGAGPFPAVLLVPGHGPTGKLGEYSWGVNLARAGILAMAIDPLGQGERLIVDQPLHRNAPEVLIPGVLREYDVAGLISTIARPVTFVNARDALGELLPETEAARVLKPSGRLRLVSRAPGDPLP